MKKLNIKLFVITAIFGCTVSISMAQKTAKEVIEYTKSIIDKPVVPLENACYLIAKERAYIRRIDSQNCTITTLLVSSGTHFIEVQYIGNKGEQTKIIPVVFDFETDKYYYLDYEITGKNILSPGSVHFFISEITDINQHTDIQEKARIARVEAQDRNEFVSYPKSNPYRFEGTWKGITKRMTRAYDNQYVFFGEKMTFELKSKGMKPYVMEGHVSFNENTLVFISEKITVNGKVVPNLQQQQKFIWYYTLIDDELSLEGGSLTSGLGSIDSIWKTDGKYHKMN